MLNPNIESFLCCESSFKDAFIVLYGAPFDSTTSYRPGARFGSGAIRRESYGLESYSPYQRRDLIKSAVFDSGDIELPMGSSEMALSQIGERCRTILDAGKLPFLLGGEHLVTLGAIREIAKKFPKVHILHFDAHADLREEYLGVSLSHACVLRRCWEIIGDGRIHQFGIRSGDSTEWEFSEAGHVFTHAFTLEGLAETLERLGDAPVYCTVDLDVLDPSVFPGTGTPEPEGVDFRQLRQAVTLVCLRANVVGCDVCELSPHYDPSGISTAAACKLVREMLLALQG